MNAANTILNARELSWGYPQRVLGRGLTLSLRPGEIMAIIGPNGAGKTTLLRVLSGQLRAVAGTIELSGDDVGTLTREAIARHVAVLPQSATIDGSLSTRELVELGRTPYLGWWGRLGKEDREVVEQALAWCELEGLAEHPLHQLSGGERQRALLAMAVAQRAPLLLLDEPTTHLDLRHRHALFELLGTLRQRTAIAVIMVLHDLAEAYREADRVLVVAEGSAHELPHDDVALANHLSHAFGVPVERLGLELVSSTRNKSRG